MRTEELVNENVKENLIRSHKSSTAFLWFRWLFAALIIVIFFVSPERIPSTFVFLETLAVAVVYNILVTLYLLKNSKDSKKIPALLAYLDVLILSVLTFQLGGINSDTYILYYFLLGYCGLPGSISSNLKTGVFSMAAYTLACILAVKYSLEDLNIMRLIVKDLLLLFAAYGISQVGREVRKYDELHKREFKLARTDRLTGLANRHYFDQKLHEEIEYADLTGNPINILLFDLDNFKRFNDTYGHMLGDKLLVLFSDIIKQNIRKSDIPVRYGGEEFLILIRDLDLFIAKSVADRIRRQLEKQRINVGNDEERKRVTVSCGVAQYPRNSNDIRKAIEQADKALYHAKEQGKNMVVAYDEIIEQDL